MGCDLQSGSVYNSVKGSCTFSAPNTLGCPLPKALSKMVVLDKCDSASSSNMAEIAATPAKRKHTVRRNNITANIIKFFDSFF